MNSNMPLECENVLMAENVRKTKRKEETGPREEREGKPRNPACYKPLK